MPNLNFEGLSFFVIHTRINWRDHRVGKALKSIEAQGNLINFIFKTVLQQILFSLSVEP